jgi:hypothetical protein
MLHANTKLSRLLTTLALAACLAAGWSTASEPKPARDPDDSATATRDEILQSPVWKETMRAWDKCLAIQKIYDVQQVKKLKQQLAEKIERMSAEELEDYLDDLEAKLQILMEAEARDARRWLNDTLSVASDKYAKKIREGLPDVANLSADELQAELDRFEYRRTQTQQSEAAIQQARKDRVRVVQAELRQQHDDEQRAMDRAAQDMNAGNQGNHFVPSTLHNRKSVADRPIGFGFGWGFW